MSQNYNRDPTSYGYGPNLGPSSNNYPNQPTNQYSGYGYGNNLNPVNPNQNVTIQGRQNLPNPNQQISWGNPQFKTQQNQYQNSNFYQNPYNQPNQWNQTIPNQPMKSDLLWNISSSTNPYDQPQQTGYRDTIKYPSLDETQKSKSTFGSLFQQAGGINKINQQVGNLNISKEQQKEGLAIWAEIVKGIDWDTIIKKKNVSKLRSDTSWVTYQEQSWLKPQLSKNIEIQTDRKFAFPNPYIKYKIIPGVDEKMALDVTAKDDLQKGLVRGNLIIWDYHGGPNQQFYIHRLPKNQQGWGNQNQKIQNDQFILINASTGFVVSAINLTVNSAKKDNKNKLCVYPKMKDSKSQRWRLKPVSQKGDIFMIQSVETGKVLDVEGQLRANGTNVLQWDENRQKNQLWKILPA